MVRWIWVATSTHLADCAHNRFDVNHKKTEKRGAGHRRNGWVASRSRRNRIDLDQIARNTIQRCFFMSSRQRPPMRHCPICGIAMQASKSQENLTYFDKFECLSCHTVITTEAKPRPPSGKREPR